jgi:putative two-component system response regulator
VYLPVFCQSNPMNAHTPLPATILVADDMEHNRELLAAMLRREGYRVVLAANGEEALDLLATGPIDLALLDVMMPRRTGMEVCREIRGKPETRLLPVLLLTGLNSSEDRVKGIQCGADDFLTKPIVKEELMARVRSLLRIKQFTDEMEHVEHVVFSLALSTEAKDPYMKGHCARVDAHSLALGRRIGLADDQLVALHRGCTVHELGRIGIDDRVLQKTGPLTPEEWIAIKTIPEIGERICRPLRLFDSVLPIIRHCHERLDGSGYPDGLKDSAIPLPAQVLAIADTYDALISHRPYRTALSPDEAFKIINADAKRGWLDGALVLELQAVIRESPAFSAKSEEDSTLAGAWG